MTQVFKKIEPNIRELYRARRKDLEMTMHVNDLTFEPGMAANTMRAILEDKGVTKVVPYDAEKALEWERPKLVVVSDEGEPPQETDSTAEPNLNDEAVLKTVRVPELATIMNRRGIPYQPGMKKMECLKLIWQHEATSGEDTP